MPSFDPARSRNLLGAVFGGLMPLVVNGPAIAEGSRQPVVVELFTSQGCSSCPPANANLIALSQRPDVLALSYAVTYWDRLGWKDTFGKPEFTERQIAYEAPLGEAGPFTPQIVVDGRADEVGNALGPLEGLIAASPGKSAVGIEIRDAVLTIRSASAPESGADIWLVHYDPRRVEVPVQRGENRGRTLAYRNVVHDITLIGDWTGGATTLPLPRAGTGLRSAVLVQGKHGGPILAATTD